jgi:PAS domain S-box-containing protein
VTAALGSSGWPAQRTNTAQRTNDELRGFLDNMPSMAWSALPDGQIDRFTAQWVNYTGMSQAEAAGNAWAAALHPDDAAGALQAWQNSLASHAPLQLLARLRAHDGSFRWFLVQAVQQRDSQGRPGRWFGNNTDIQDQRSAAQALARLNETLAQQVSDRTADRDRLWHLSTDIMLVAGFNGVLTAVNPAWTAVLGWTEDELIGHRLFDFIHRADLERSLDGASTLIAGQPLTQFENRHRHKNGGFRWISWSAVSGEGQIIAVGRDITAEKERTDALQRSEAQVRSIFETSFQYLGLMTPEGTMLDANRTSLAGIQARLEDIVGLRLWDTPWFTGTPGMPEQVKAALPQVAAGQSFRQEVVVDLPIGRRVFDLSMRPVFDTTGAVIAIVPEAMDLTEQRAVEAQLRQSQKMQAIGHLTGGVAHDFNNLLQVISGNLHLISRFAAGNAPVEQRVANALAAVQRGAKLAGELLAFSRRQALEPKVVNVSRLAASMEDMLHRALGENIEVQTLVADPAWNTFIDPAQIENAVLNLALNARDAMLGSGKLTVGVGNACVDAANAAEHPAVVPGEYVILAVSDTGSGMTPEVLAQAFEPFFSTKPVGSGTGLGLSMVYGFVKQSGGHIRIHSEVGRGTTVKLYLPRTRQVEDTSAALDDGPVIGGTETVLVAEDDEGVRATVLEMLSELGYRVLTANDAASARTVLESGVPVDLLFTDVVMPGPLKSPELAHRARELLPNIAVLFTSGYSESAIVHGGRLDAGVDLLPKPYTRDALARKLRHVLARQAQRNRAVAGRAGA